MRDWYVIHDYENNPPRVGFKRMPNSYLPEPVDPIDWPDNSNTNAPNTPSKPTPTDPDNSDDKDSGFKGDPKFMDYVNVGIGVTFVAGIFSWAAITAFC